MLAVHGLYKDYAGLAVLADLSFALGRGETLSVIGASGCGKSTLLALLAGLEKPGAGEIVLESGVRSSFILQDYGLFPWKSVQENIVLPLVLKGQSLQQAAPALAGILAELGLHGLDARYPAQLSGGQRQRVAIGRALISRPDILLMDEPFSSLDALTRENLQDTLLNLWRTLGLSYVLVTHSVEEAVLLGQYVMVLGSDPMAPPGDSRPQPSSIRLWLANPCFGQDRDSVELHAIVRQVRAALPHAAAL